jgi:para-nitrobenzyl esterase
MLGVAPTREEVAAVPLERLIEAQFALATQVRTAPDPNRWGEIAGNGMAFEPVVDGSVVSAVPIEGIGAGAGAAVDVLVGSNSEEMRLFLLPTGVLDAATQSDLDRAVAGYRLPPSTVSTYAAARPGASPGELLAAISTDWFYGIPALRVAEARAGGPAPTYLYEFAWPSPRYDGRLKACHALEIGFTFDTLDHPDGDRLLGAAPPQQLADIMHRAWVSFVRTGDPGWPRYDLGRRPVMRFADTCTVIDDPRPAEHALWDGIR